MAGTHPDSNEAGYVPSRVSSRALKRNEKAAQFGEVSPYLNSHPLSLTDTLDEETQAKRLRRKRQEVQAQKKADRELEKNSTENSASSTKSAIPSQTVRNSRDFNARPVSTISVSLKIIFCCIVLE